MRFHLLVGSLLLLGACGNSLVGSSSSGNLGSMASNSAASGSDASSATGAVGSTSSSSGHSGALGSTAAVSASATAGGSGHSSSSSSSSSGNSSSSSSSGTAGGTAAVNLGSAGDFVIIAETEISTVPTSAITGDLALSPAAATFITGFSMTADSTNVFSISSQVTGRIYAADDASPTPSNLTTAVEDMEIAYTDAAGRSPDFTNLGAGNIGGRTLTPGVYVWNTDLLIPTDVSLNGSATDVWIFVTSGNLTVSNATQVLLGGGALAKNVFWAVSGMAEVGTTAHLEGIVLCQTQIALATGASLNGRLLAQSAVTTDANTIVEPAP